MAFLVESARNLPKRKPLATECASGGEHDLFIVALAKVHAVAVERVAECDSADALAAGLLHSERGSRSGADDRALVLGESVHEPPHEERARIVLVGVAALA